MRADCYCDAERPTLFVKTDPVARTRHVCTECRGWVEPGERYQRVTGVWDGFFSVYKTCPDCVALIDYIEAHLPCYCRLFQGLHETAREDLQYLVSEADYPAGMGMETGRLLVRCRRRARARRAERATQKEVTK